jgi:broad specificity phosphatase PhoE
LLHGCAAKQQLRRSLYPLYDGIFMGTLYLVRHGQASFGAANYDQLSPLGFNQAQALGHYFADKFAHKSVAFKIAAFDAAITGTLHRQIQTCASIMEGMGAVQPALEVQRRPGLNEYDSEAVLHAIHPGPLTKPDSPELYRHHFRLLREGLTAWMAGKVQPLGMPSYADWRQSMVDALDDVRSRFASQPDARVLMVSSGGPISTMVGYVLGTSAETTIEMNLRIRNSSVTELVFNPKRHMLLTYNTLPHLDDEAHADWVTYT